ncbi:hypothetical protein BJ170DRAFT_71438 [Xylariales sp. AK1849]|nr:hypothetical protein BJ170DRAFT_71438 [Xylariales sp. AK1849]
MENKVPEDRPRRQQRPELRDVSNSVDASAPVGARPAPAASASQLEVSVGVGIGDGESASIVSKPSVASLPGNDSSQDLVKDAAPFARGLASQAPSARDSLDGTAPTTTEFLRPPALPVDPHLSRDSRHLSSAVSTTDIINDYLDLEPPRSRSDSISSQLSVEFAPENVGASRAHRPVPLKTRFGSLRKPGKDVLDSALSPIESVSGASDASPRTPVGPAIGSVAASAAEATTPVTPAAPGATPGAGAATPPVTPGAKPAAAPPGPMNDPKKKLSKKAVYGQTIRQFLRIFSYATRKDRFVIAAATIGAIGTGLTFPAMTIVFGNLVGNITSSKRTFAGETPQEMMTSVIDQSV